MHDRSRIPVGAFIIVPALEKIVLSTACPALQSEAHRAQRALLTHRQGESTHRRVKALTARVSKAEPVLLSMRLFSIAWASSFTCFFDMQTKPSATNVTPSRINSDQHFQPHCEYRECMRRCTAKSEAMDDECDACT